MILSRAADLDVGLIVIGLYGHSRLRETVLGGASRTLLASVTVPSLSRTEPRRGCLGTGMSDGGGGSSSGMGPARALGAAGGP